MFHRSWRQLLLFVFAGCGLFLASPAARSEGDVSELPANATPDALVDKLWVIASTILDKHIEPPTRQEMLLGAARGLFKAAGLAPPHELSQQVSERAAEGELRAVLADAWRAAAKSSSDTAMLEAAAIGGLLQAVPGGGGFLSSKEFAVQQQVSENRYVGIGIELAFEGGLPYIRKAIRRGPLHRAGGRDEDRIVAVNGKSTQKLKLEEVVELLRGAEGTAVQVELRAPKATESRTLEIVRGVVPLETVEGFRRVDDDWDYRVDEESPIGYVRFTSIGPSTLLELRAAAERMRSQGARAVILDLRDQSGGSVHHAAIVADALLPTGKIGRVQRINGTREYESRPDHLFSGWPMAVIVNRGTRAEAEWVAAAVQDNHRATLVGERTLGDAYVDESVALPRELGAVRLRVAVLQRGDGRALLSTPPSRGVFPFVVPSDMLGMFGDGGVFPENIVQAENRGWLHSSPAERDDPFIARAIQVLGAQIADSE